MIELVEFFRKGKLVARTFNGLNMPVEDCDVVIIHEKLTKEEFLKTYGTHSSHNIAS